MIAVVVVTLAALTVFFGVGVLGLRAAGVRGWGFPPVVAVVIGHVACVSLFAVVVSHGRTALAPLLAALVAAALLWRRFGAHDATEGRLDVGALVEQVVVAVVAAVVMVSPMLVDGTLIYGGLQQDNLHYTRLAAFVNDLGAECMNADRVVGSVCRRTPYHFFDIWTAALLSHAGLHMTLAFSGASSAVLTSSLHGACRGLARRLGAGRLAGAVALVALVGIPESWLHLRSVGFLTGAEIFGSNLLFANKMLPASVMLVLAAWAWATPCAVLTPLLLAAVGVVHATLAPFAGVVCAALLAHDLWHGERARARAGLVAVGMLGAIGLWLLIEGRINPGGTVPSSELTGYIGSARYLRTAVNAVGKTVLQVLIELAPYALLAALAWSPSSTRAWLRSAHGRLGLALLALGLLASLGLWALIHHHADSVQVFGNLSSSLFPLAIVVALARALAPEAIRRGLGRLALGLLLLVGGVGTAALFRGRQERLHRPPSGSFRSSAASLLAGAPGLGVRFIDASTMTTIFTSNLSQGSPSYLLVAAPSSYEVVIPVGEPPLPSDPVARAMTSSLLRLAAFPRFAERETGAMRSDPETIRRFVATIPFDHVVCEGEVVRSYCQRQACEGDSPMAYCRGGDVGTCIEDGPVRLCRPGR